MLGAVCATALTPVGAAAQVWESKIDFLSTEFFLKIPSQVGSVEVPYTSMMYVVHPLPGTMSLLMADMMLLWLI